MKIGLIGYGDLARQVERFLLEDGIQDNEIKAFDDNYVDQTKIFSFADYLNEEFKNLEFIVCLGYNHLAIKREILSGLLKKRRKIRNFVHKSSYLSPSVKLGKGVIIFPMCNIDAEVFIDDGVLINNSVTVSHNSIIGNSSFLAPGTTISGNVKIGDCVFIGTGSVLSNGITVGDESKIGIGSCVTHSIPAKSFCIGNPIVFKNNISLK